MPKCPDCSGRLSKVLTDATLGLDAVQSRRDDYYWKCQKCGVGFEQEMVSTGE